MSPAGRAYKPSHLPAVRYGNLWAERSQFQLLVLAPMWRLFSLHGEMCVCCPSFALSCSEGFAGVSSLKLYCIRVILTHLALGSYSSAAVSFQAIQIFNRSLQLPSVAGRNVLF